MYKEHEDDMTSLQDDLTNCKLAIYDLICELDKSSREKKQLKLRLRCFYGDKVYKVKAEEDRLLATDKDLAQKLIKRIIKLFVLTKFQSTVVE